jgi:hypothetical protein
LMVSKLVAESLSDDIEDGIGGIFIDFENCSIEDRVRTERVDGVLRSLRSPSLLFFKLIKLGGAAGLPALWASVTSGFVGPSVVICDDLEEFLEWTAAGTRMISATVIELLLNGERLRFFSILLGSATAGAGDGDLEGDRNDLRAMLRIVPVTERPRPFVGSIVSILACLIPLVGEPPFSLSYGRLNFAPFNLFFAFLDALRNSSLFAIYPVPLVLMALSGGKESICSELVRLRQLLSASPSRVTSAELAERGNSVIPVCRLGIGSKVSTECRGECPGLHAWAGAVGSTLTFASDENIALWPAKWPAD